MHKLKPLEQTLCFLVLYYIYIYAIKFELPYE